MTLLASYFCHVIKKKKKQFRCFDIDLTIHIQKTNFCYTSVFSTVLDWSTQTVYIDKIRNDKLETRCANTCI